MTKWSLWQYNNKMTYPQLFYIRFYIRIKNVALHLTRPYFRTIQQEITSINSKCEKEWHSCECLHKILQKISVHSYRDSLLCATFLTAVTIKTAYIPVTISELIKFSLTKKMNQD